MMILAADLKWIVDFFFGEKLLLLIIIGVVVTVVIGVLIYLCIRHTSAAKAPLVPAMQHDVVCLSAFPEDSENFPPVLQKMEPLEIPHAGESALNRVVATMPPGPPVPPPPAGPGIEIRRTLPTGRVLRVELSYADVMARGGCIRIGRAEDTDLRFGEGRVSRYHAQIIAVDGRYDVMDSGSANGTIFRGQQLNAHVRTPLGDGGELNLGGVSVLILIH